MRVGLSYEEVWVKYRRKKVRLIGGYCIFGVGCCGG